MILIIGLGNPGEKYQNNRHNAGFIVLDKIQKELNFSDFKFDKKFDAEISEGFISVSSRAERSEVEGSNKILLTKPQTFMNNSGESAQKIMSFYKLVPADIIVVHDDLDIEIGNWKISSEISSAGHRGVQDIMDKLGTQNFKRIRIGVETESGRQNRNIPGEDFVLQDFSEEEMEKVKNIIPSVEKEITAFTPH